MLEVKVFSLDILRFEAEADIQGNIIPLALMGKSLPFALFQ